MLSIFCQYFAKFKSMPFPLPLPVLIESHRLYDFQYETKSMSNEIFSPYSRRDQEFVTRLASDLDTQAVGV